MVTLGSRVRSRDFWNGVLCSDGRGRLGTFGMGSRQRKEGSDSDFWNGVLCSEEVYGLLEWGLMHR